MTPQELAARCERIDGEVGGGPHPDAIFVVANGDNTAEVWVSHYFGGCEKFRITVESLGEVSGGVRVSNYVHHAAQGDAPLYRGVSPLRREGYEYSVPYSTPGPAERYAGRAGYVEVCNPTWRRLDAEPGPTLEAQLREAFYAGAGIAADIAAECCGCNAYLDDSAFDRWLASRPQSPKGKETE